MARRSASARFMAGAWVFPGGVVDDADRGAGASAALGGTEGLDDLPWRVAALRELVEETGMWPGLSPHVFPATDRPSGSEVWAAVARHGPVDATRLALLSNWVTPTAVPVRFDARFYVAVVDGEMEPIADGVEMDTAAWVDPAAMLAEADAGDVLLALPTRVTLHHFAQLGDPDRIVSGARNRRVEPILPRVRLSPLGEIDIVLPGEAGYEDLTDLPPDPESADEPVRVAEFDARPIPELRD
jgi:recombination protein RecT